MLRGDGGELVGRRLLAKAGAPVDDLLARADRLPALGIRRLRVRGAAWEFESLREFVDGYPWVHMDVASTAYTESDSPPLPKGPAGVPVRLFIEFVLGRAG